MKKAIINLLLMVIAIIQLYPLVWMVFLSLKSNSEIYGGGSMGFPRSLRWDNYISAMQTGNVLRYTCNSLVITASAVLLSTLLASMAAYSITRMRWRYSGWVMMIFLMGIMVPSQAVILPIYLILQRAGLYNTQPGLVIVYLVFALPTAIFILSGFLKSLPVELEEAAALDGAGILYIYHRVILPLTRPALSAVMVFTFLSCWNEFMYSFILLDKETLRTLTVGLLAMKGQYYTNWGAMAAGLTIAALPTLAVYLCFSKNIQQRFVAGAVKG